jgi:hypothetical protein
MAYQRDDIPRKNCFSLTDFNEFESCPFRFFVYHNMGLGKKYELSEGNLNMALGSLLDETIKLFHRVRAYGQPPEYIRNLIKASCNKMKDKIQKQAGPSFFSLMEPYLNDETCEKAAEIFINYYKALGCKIKPTLGEVDFCEWVLICEGQKCKLWGWPDTYELGDDGIPEVCDYKFREDVEKGKANMDMDIMPKAYMLLASKFLLSKGYKKARFIVRFWQDPGNNDFYEEFDLEKVLQFEELFKQKIGKIIKAKEFNFCTRPFCNICKYDKKDDLVFELRKMGILLMEQEKKMVLQEELTTESAVI